MILKLSPALKNYIWGGTNLKTKWNKVSKEEKIAESWELSLNEAGMCRVKGGKYDGQPLNQVLTAADFGSNSEKFPFFPVLVKLIDSLSPLSVQVHPTDSYALKYEHKFGKTEMWHIIDAKKDAFIYLGFNRKITEEEFLKALNDNTLCNLLNKVPVAPNQTYFVPSGTIHAIGAGVTLIEIQQNSDLTYRIYDYDRVDVNGNKRELHIEKALKVLDFNRYVVPKPARYEFLGKCKYFTAYRYSGKRTIDNKDSFTSVTVLRGEISVENVLLRRGETAFISAGTTAHITGEGQYVAVCVEK